MFFSLHSPMTDLAGFFATWRLHACHESLQIYVKVQPCSARDTWRTTQLLPSTSPSAAMICRMMEVCSTGSSTGWLIRASIALILRVAGGAFPFAAGATLDLCPPSSGSMLDAFSGASFSGTFTGISKTAVARISNVTETCSARVSVTLVLRRSRNWAWRSATEPHDGLDWPAPSNASIAGLAVYVQVAARPLIWIGLVELWDSLDDLKS